MHGKTVKNLQIDSLLQGVAGYHNSLFS